MKKWVVGLTIPLVLVGCDQLLKAAGTKLPGSLGEAALNDGVQTTLSGVALGPASLVGNNASNLVSNNVGNLIANNINGLVSNNVSGLTTAGSLAQTFSVLSLTEVPLPGVEVALLSLSGTVAATGSTDASGHYALTALQGSYAVEAAYQVGTSTIHEDNLAGAGVVDAASTLAIDALTGKAGGTLVGYSPSDVASVVSAMEGAITDSAAQSLTGSPAARVAAFGQIAQQTPGVQNAFNIAVANRAARISGTTSSSSTSTTTSSSSTSTSSSTTSTTSSTTTSTSSIALSSFASAPGISLGTDPASGSPELMASASAAESLTVETTANLAVPQGATLDFELLVGKGSQNPSSGYPAFLQMQDSSGTVLLEAALYDQSAGGIPTGMTACGSGTTQQGDAVACAATEQETIEFALKAPAGVAKIVFGGTGTTFTSGLEQVKIIN